MDQLQKVNFILWKKNIHKKKKKNRNIITFSLEAIEL